MKRTTTAAIILTIAMAILASGCTVSQNSATPGVSADLEDSYDDNDLLVPGDDDDIVVVDEGSDVADEATDGDDDTDSSSDASSGDVEILTASSDIEDVKAKAGEPYTGTLIVVAGGSGEGFSWEHNLPSGFKVEPHNSSASKVYVKSTSVPTEEIVGEYDVTLTATDVGGDGESDSVSFKLVVESSLVIVNLNDNLPDPCDTPLSVTVVENNWVDAENKNTDLSITRTLGRRDHRIKLEVQGGKPPYTWSWTSRVEESEHCYYGGDYYQNGSYAWKKDGSCQVTPDNMGKEPLEERLTRNPTWHVAGEETEEFSHDEGVPAKFSSGPINSRNLTLKGEFRYVGPLPVDGMPLDENPYEVLTVSVKSACDAPELRAIDDDDPNLVISNLGRSKTFRYSLKYNDDPEHMKVKIKFRKTDHMNSSCSSSDNYIHCHNDYRDDFSGSFLGVFLQPSKNHDLFDCIWNKYQESADLDETDEYDYIRDIHECGFENSYSYAVFKLWQFPDKDEEGNDWFERTVDVSNIISAASMSGTDEILLFWGQMVPRRIDNDTISFNQIDVKNIVFKSDYWTASFWDDDDIYSGSNDDFRWGDGVRYDYITYRDNTVPKPCDESGEICPNQVTNNGGSYPGMSNPNPSGGVFKRRAVPFY